MIRGLALRLGKALGAAGRTLAVAESCTGGGLCAAVTEIPGSSAYFLGGVVSYGNASKSRDLGVPASLIESRGAVSEPVAAAMADGARERFGADIGIGITGIAGPGGGTPEKPPGTVCLAVSAGRVRRSYRRRFRGDRGAVRRSAVAWALRELLAVSAQEGRAKG